MSILKSRYYDYPEGQDAFGKVVAINKFAAPFGLAYATIDVLAISKTQGALQTLARYGYCAGPMIGMATAFTVGTYMSTNIRDVDDKWNYVVGSMLAGGVYGGWKRTVTGGVVMGIFFSIAGFVKKISVEEGWEFFPKRNTYEWGSLTSTTHNLTLTRDRPRNWTTNPDEA